MPDSPTPQAVVFDLDGLMLNTEELYQDVGSELLRRRGYQMEQKLLDRMMGRPSRVALKIMIQWFDLHDTVAELESETDVIFDGMLEDRLAPMPGLLDLLSALETAEIPKAVATSGRKVFVHKVLDMFDLRSRFSFLLTAEDVEQGKPHPEIYQKSARSFQLTPAEILVLEDSANGCLAAVSAGTFAVAVPGDHSKTHDFTGARLVVDSLSDRRIYQALGLDS